MHSYFLPVILFLSEYLRFSAYRRTNARYIHPTYNNNNYAGQKTVSTSLVEENQKIDVLIKYKKMLDEGIITKQEFENKKREIVGK